MNEHQISARILSAVGQFRERFGVPASVLKILAVISMLIDHTGATVLRVLPRYSVVSSVPELSRLISRMYYYSRRFGRLAFPIYCFLLVEGFLHTRDVRKYAARLFIFALISEFPFDFALHHAQPFMEKQNVYFTLLIGLLVLWGVRELSGCIPGQLALMCMGMFLAKAMNTDYRFYGVFLIEALYILRFSRLLQCLGGGAYMQYEKMPTPLAFIPVFLYNGKRGRQMKYFYYWFYPAHLLILGLITYYLLPRLLG